MQDQPVMERLGSKNPLRSTPSLHLEISCADPESSRGDRAQRAFPWFFGGRGAASLLPILGGNAQRHCAHFFDPHPP